jgi:hypothetical protein
VVDVWGVPVEVPVDVGPELVDWVVDECDEAVDETGVVGEVPDGLEPPMQPLATTSPTIRKTTKRPFNLFKFFTP